MKFRRMTKSELANIDGPAIYYQLELSKLEENASYAYKIQCSDGFGTKTNHMNLNSESIPVIIAWLKDIQKTLKEV